MLHTPLSRVRDVASTNPHPRHVLNTQEMDVLTTWMSNYRNFLIDNNSLMVSLDLVVDPIADAVIVAGYATRIAVEPMRSHELLTRLQRITQVVGKGCALAARRAQEEAIVNRHVRYARCALVFFLLGIFFISTYAMTSPHTFFVSCVTAFIAWMAFIFIYPAGNLFFSPSSGVSHPPHQLERAHILRTMQQNLSLISTNLTYVSDQLQIGAGLQRVHMQLIRKQIAQGTQLIKVYHALP